MLHSHTLPFTESTHVAAQYSDDGEKVRGGFTEHQQSQRRTLTMEKKYTTAAINICKSQRS